MSVAERGRPEAAESEAPALPATVRLPNIGILTDLGKQRRKAIKRLKRGDGPLKRQIQATLHRSCEELGIAPEAEVVPVVILYRCPSAITWFRLPRTEEKTLRTKVKSPIVVDLGKTRRADVDELRNCAGRLVEDVEQVMRLVRADLDAQDDKRILLPLVVIYSKA
jgi:hypothetical protein